MIWILLWALIHRESPAGASGRSKKGGSCCPCDYKDNGNGGKRPPVYRWIGQKLFRPGQSYPIPTPIQEGEQMGQGIIETGKCVIVPIGIDYSPEPDILYCCGMYYRNRKYRVYITREAFYESFGRWVSNLPYSGDILIGKKEPPRIDDFSPDFGAVKFRDGIYYPSHTDHPTPIHQPKERRHLCTQSR